MAIGSSFTVIVLSAILVPLVALSDLSVQQCLNDLRYHRTDTSTASAIRTCKKKVEWKRKADIGKSHGYQPLALGISKAQIDFMDSLSDNAAIMKSQGISTKDSTDWPYRPPGAKARKEYRMMTDEERHRFHNAINVLKSFYIDDKNNVYDTFVSFHNPEVSPAAHFGPNFIGWHREYLHRFEKALQFVDPDVTIPYWDTRMDAMLEEDAVNSIMWSEDFMGNKRGDVVTGPFKNWIMKVPIQNRTQLWRGETEVDSLFSDYEYNYTVTIDNFRNSTYYVDPFFEARHGNNHGWVNGVMDDLTYSPSDPVFWLHHAFLDFIWYNQQARVFKELGRQHYFYPREDDEEAYGGKKPSDSPHFYDNPMWPFTEKRNHQGLSDIYWLYRYYDPSPTCNYASLSCGSPYLFCMPEISKCVPKLQMGANCANFKDYDSCYDGQCIDDRCTSAGKV